MSSIQKIAIVGGSGQSGTHIVEALLASGKFTITAITREESSSTFPDHVEVRRGDYSSEDFLTSALQGQDVLIIILGASAPHNLQHHLIRAAAAASVPWVLPCEFSPDTGSKLLCDVVPILAAKKEYRDEIEKLGKSNWIGFVTGFWFDYSLANGAFGLNIKERTARLYDDGNTPISASTFPQVGRAMAKLLELPLATLDKFKNNFVYANSFHVSQMDILRSLCKATGSQLSDWKITKIPSEEASAIGLKAFQTGDRSGFIDGLYGSTFRPGFGGNFEHKSTNKVLGLEEDNLDEVVKWVVKDQNEILGRMPKWS